VKEKLVSLTVPKKVSVDPIARKQLLDNALGSELLKDENNALEREIKKMEERLQAIAMTR